MTDAPVPSGEPEEARSWPVHTKMLVGLVAGLLLGLAANAWLDPALLDGLVKNVAQPLGGLFLNLIFMVVVPLVASSVILGVLELGTGAAIGRVGLRTLLATVICSASSVIIGVSLVNVVQPGAGVTKATREALLKDAGHQKTAATALENAKKAQEKHWSEGLLSLVPRNPLAAATNALTGDMLALMVFCVLFGAALARVRGPPKEEQPDDPLVGLLRTVQQVSMKIIGWAMKLGPWAVGALLFAVAARTGLDVLKTLLGYALVVVVGLALQLVLVYGALLRLVAEVSPLEWLRRCRGVILTAFSTSSSNATLPTSLETAAGPLGIQPRIGTFVLTVGATGNQNGTALFEGVTVLFLAQVFGIALDLQTQVYVVLMSILAGVGTAGVPGGSLPLIVIVLQQAGIPPEGIAIILGVDRFLDMCRTVVNVVGDLVVATVVAKGEGALDFAGAKA